MSLQSGLGTGAKSVPGMTEEPVSQRQPMIGSTLCTLCSTLRPNDTLISTVMKSINEHQQFKNLADRREGGHAM